MKNVIIYTRVSTEEQKERGYSLGYQKESIERFCKIKGYNIIQHFEDDYTGTTFDRPDFNKLIVFCKTNKKEVDLILFVKWDRFARNASEAFEMMRKLRNWGIQVNSSEQPLDLEQPESKLMLSNYLVMGEIESDKTSIRTKDALHHAAKLGRFTGRAPYGYSSHRDEFKNSTLIKNKDSENVIESFKLMSKGIYTYEEVRQIMLKKGFKKHKSAFKNLLENITYVGKILVKEHRDEPEMIVKGLHEGIIDEDIFNKVQDILKGNNKKISKANKRNPELPLRGHLICHQCGGNMTGERSKGNGGHYHYYRCQNGCKERFSASNAHLAFDKYLQNITIPNEVAELYSEIVKDIFKEKEGDRDTQIVKINKSIKEVETNQIKLEEQFYIKQDGMGKETFNRLNKLYTNQLIDNKNQIQLLQDTDSNINKYFDFGISIFTNTSVTYDTAPIDVKQKFIGSVFPNKLIFNENSYRTNIDDNSMLGLIFNIKGLEKLDKKKATINSGLYWKAPLSVLLSNQFYNDLKRIYQLRKYLSVQHSSETLESI